MTSLGIVSTSITNKYGVTNKYIHHPQAYSEILFSSLIEKVEEVFRWSIPNGATLTAFSLVGHARIDETQNSSKYCTL